MIAIKTCANYIGETVSRKKNPNNFSVFKKPTFCRLFLIKQQGTARNCLPVFFLGALETH